MAIQLHEVAGSIGRRHHSVVVAKKDERARRHARYVLVRAILFLVTLAGMLAQEVVERPLMSITFHHGNDRIEEYLEVGLGRSCALRGNHRGQMSACREAHHAHFIVVYAPAFCRRLCAPCAWPSRHRIRARRGCPWAYDISRQWPQCLDFGRTRPSRSLPCP